MSTIMIFLDTSGRKHEQAIHVHNRNLLFLLFKPNYRGIDSVVTEIDRVPDGKVRAIFTLPSGHSGGTSQNAVILETGFVMPISITNTNLISLQKLKHTTTITSQQTSRPAGKTRMSKNKG